MSPVENRFLALLVAGIWKGEVDVTPFQDGISTDWEAIYACACKQAVVGLVFDGIELLPPDLYPPKNLIVKWYAEVVCIERANKMLDEALVSIFSSYKSLGIKPILLKGQGIGRIYPCPEHRQPGDIDLYFGKDYIRSKQLLQTAGIALEAEGEKHFGYTFKGVEVENHRYVACFYHPIRNRRLQKWVDRWMEEGLVKLVWDGQDLFLPLPGFNAIFLLIHSLLHFIPMGIGLRQVCDWALLLQTYHREIDWERFLYEIKRLELEEALMAFGYVAVHYLGLPASCLPSSVSVEEGARTGEFLMNDIMQGGNFGVARMECVTPAGKWSRVWHNYKVIKKRCEMLAPFWGSEARCYPFYRTLNWLNKKRKGLN